MTDAAVANLNNQVLWMAFFASAVFGATSLRTNFCTMGAVSDAVLMGDYTRARQWLLAAGVACLGYGLLIGIGGLDPSKSLYASPKLLWLSAVTGGAMFGFGMVLASGCGSKTLVRLGAGNLKSLVVFLVMGIAAFATLKGITAVGRVNSVDKIAIDIGANYSIFAQTVGLFGLKSAGFWIVGLTAGAAAVLACALNKEFRSTDNWLAGVGLGGVVVFMTWLSGLHGFVAEHPQTLEAAYLATASGRIEAMSFVAPVAHSLDWVMFFSDKSKLLSFGVVSVVGVVAGAATYALATGSFRWEGFRNAQDTGLHLAGAVLMGVGGVTAMGCTIGQGLSGLATLSYMSFIAVAAIVGGAIAGLKFQTWLLELE